MPPENSRSATDASRKSDLRGRQHGLLANTESAENHTQQVVGGELAGDRVKPLLSQAQFLCEQIQLPVALARVLLGDRQMLTSASQGTEMSLAGDELPFTRTLPTGQLQEHFAQHVDTFAGSGGQARDRGAASA